MAIFLRHDDELITMQEQPYEAEAVLQELLARYPGLLSGEQDRDRHWILVRRELGVAAAEGGPDRWSLDHLFLDEEGVPTLVEVKRSADSRTRRAVVGQMLDYAANAVAYLDADKIRSTFEARCEADGHEPDGVLAETLAIEEEVAEFWERVKTNLAAGKLRLVFVADEIPAELQRIVEFLNEQMSSTEVLALEVKQYAEEGGDRQTLVSRVIGRTAAAQQRKGKAQPESEWTWADYSGVLPETQLATARALVDAVTAAVGERGLDWQAVFRPYWIAFQRAGGYTVVVILLRRALPVLLEIRLPGAPSDLGLDNPFPKLNDKWKARTSEWAWEIPFPEETPDVGVAIDIARKYHPAAGPLGSGAVE